MKDKVKIVLGSKSERRRELLELIGYDFYVDFVEIDESLESFTDPYDYVEKVVTKKAIAVSTKHRDEIVVCADTIVVVDDIILGKPKDINDARDMLNVINNKDHLVMTGVVIRYKDIEVKFVEETSVFIDNISEEDIEEYINTSEPYDKAGGYAIQGLFAKHIRKINGDFYNVMGLPINKLNNEINKIINTL